MKKLLIATLFLVPLHEAAATTTQERGFQIASEADRRDTGYRDMNADMVMILRNRSGDESRRKIRFRSLEVVGDGDKSLTIFDSPNDIKGTAFLSFTHALSADDQWLYLPAVKRTKRIASDNKSGPFVGSEFAYEDLTSPELDKYEYNLLAEDVFDGKSCFILEFIPKYEHSGYRRQKVWMDAERYIPLKIEFYDRKDSLLKTLTYGPYQQYLSQYWRPDWMNMVNHQTGKSTDLQWSNYSFQTGLSDADFHRGVLRRIR